MNKLFEGRSLRLLAAAIVVLNGFFPAVWILLTSLKTEAELVSKPITYLPHQLVLSNYVQAFTDQPLLKYLGNSLVVAAVSTAVALTVAAFAAYAIARLNLRYRQLILTCIVASSMFPLVTLLVPIFETMRNLNLLNSYTALVLPYTVLSLPVCTLVLVSFFQSIPKDLENAALIDGCTRIGALWRVVVPLAAPGVFTAAILTFFFAWNEFVLAISLTSTTGSRTVPAQLSFFVGPDPFNPPYGLLATGSVVVTVPIIVIVLLFQRKIVAGLTSGAVKG